MTAELEVYKHNGDLREAPVWWLVWCLIWGPPSVWSEELDSPPTSVPISDMPSEIRWHVENLFEKETAAAFSVQFFRDRTRSDHAGFLEDFCRIIRRLPPASKKRSQAMTV
jgi:hypothetical protein